MVSIKKVLAEAERQHAILNENCSISNVSLYMLLSLREITELISELNSDVTRFRDLR